MAKENHLYYKPTAEGMAKIELLRAKVIELDDLIDELVGVGSDKWSSKEVFPSVTRPWSISKTKLEECRQRAIEAIVRLHSDSQ